MASRMAIALLESGQLEEAHDERNDGHT